MFNNLPKERNTVNFHLQLLKLLLLITNTIGLLIYIFLHFIFFDFPFEGSNELITLLKLFTTTSGFALCISVLVLAVDVTELVIIKKRTVLIPGHLKTVSIALIALIVILASSCNTPVTVGIKKDFTTGLSSSYNGIEPEKTFLVMNNEVLNHTDIPLGESFLVVNDGIKGMQVKNGKVKVGCSLSITDEQGKVVLNEKDLFDGHDEFEEKNAKMLKCTVSTGQPMQSEENYNVAVTFWDKNGTGKVENKVTIRSIDMP